MSGRGAIRQRTRFLPGRLGVRCPPTGPIRNLEAHAGPSCLRSSADQEQLVSAQQVGSSNLSGGATGVRPRGLPGFQNRRLGVRLPPPQPENSSPGCFVRSRPRSSVDQEQLVSTQRLGSSNLSGGAMWARGGTGIRTRLKSGRGNSLQVRILAGPPIHFSMRPV